MRERAVRIGKPTALFGVITEPDKLDAEKPMVLIFNSGVMHHIGTCRLSVKLARSLADIGLGSIRFDFSSIGDSEARRGGLSFEQSAPIEAAEVMDYLQSKRGVSQFILFGLCSGADATYTTALVDTRVVGIAQIDAYCYRTTKYYWNYYRGKIFDPLKWVNFVKRKVGERFNRSNSNDNDTEEYFEVASYVREFPPQETVAQGLQKLLDRQVAMNVIFTGGEVHYNYPNQYRESFKGQVDFADLLALHYYQESGHIITQPHCQKNVIKELTQWMDGVANIKPAST